MGPADAAMGWFGKFRGKRWRDKTPPWRTGHRPFSISGSTVVA
jgi:hypothetical protein